MPVADIAAMPAVARASAAHPARLVALDHLRGCIVALVVLHHSVLAYCRFGQIDAQHYLWSSAPIVDPEHWAGFDLLVWFNDSFFMPLMFLLSGLFVWPSLARKGPAGYVRGRLLRLGLPFAVAATTLIPLAYYPSFRMTGADAGFWQFWSDMVFSGPWPSGPLWFIAVLLGFDAVVVLLFSLGPHPRLSPTRLSPLAFAGLLVTLSAIAYLPLLAEFGARRWLTFGPFATQANRIGLYALYFLAGVWLGRGGADQGLIAPAGALPRH